MGDGWIEVEGGQLNYEESGSGAPLVLLHGFSLDLRSWDEQFELFAGHYRAIRYDLRGFGKSSLPRESQPYSHAGDLVRLLDQLGLESAALMGLSMGGAVAVDFALEHPKLVDGLVLVDSMLNGYRWTDAASNLYRAVIRRAREAGVDAARQLWQHDPLFETAMGLPKVAARFTSMVAGYSGWHWLYRDPQLSLNPPAIERLSEIRTPSLVIVGERDVPDMQGMASTLEAGIPGARKVIIPDAGHLSNMEAPGVFNETVQAFLRSF